MSEIISPREANAKRWHELLTEQAVSGKSIRIFCFEHQINQSTFKYWREKLSYTAQKSGDVSRSSRFIAVARNDLNFKSASPRIVLPNGVTIDLGDGLGATDVKKFLLKLCGVDLGGADAKS